jgi:hypothetical protein
VNAKDPSGRDDDVEYQFLFTSVPKTESSLLGLVIDIDCVFLAEQALIDKIFHQDLTGTVPWPVDAACFGRGLWLLFFP